MSDLKRKGKSVTLALETIQFSQMFFFKEQSEFHFLKKPL